MFDLLHIGHIELFRKARLLGNYLIVAVQESHMVRKFKPNTTLVYSTDERMYMVKSIRYVDNVISYTEVDKIINLIEFDILIVGPDQKHSGFIKAIDWCKNNGKEVVTLQRTDNISSSVLKERIKRM